MTHNAFTPSDPHVTPPSLARSLSPDRAWATREPAAEPVPRNRLLRALSSDDRALLGTGMERVQLRSLEVLVRAGETATHVWFPDHAVVALQLALGGRGAETDVLAIGREGVVALCSALGGAPMTETAIVRVAGSAWRMSATLFRRAMSTMPSFRALVDRYVQGMALLIECAAPCQRTHAIPARLATLLLQLEDRLESTLVPLTHEQLARMLCVRRAGVTLAAAKLRDRGAVSYRRGRLEITSRDLLDAEACICHSRILERLYPATTPST